MRQSRIRAALVVVLSVLLLAVMPIGASAKSASPVVMTRNLYLGADLAAAIQAPNALALAQAAADIYLNVIATDFPTRAELIAEEIAATAPDLVGLQEAAIWRTGGFADPAPAESVAYDYLGSLLMELDELGLDYHAAVVQPTFDGEVPASVSSGGVPVLMDVRLTQRNVILVRSGIAYENATAEYFETNTVFPDIGGIPGNDLTDLRGWVSVDVALEPKGKDFTFLNTHLDPYVPPVRDAQAQQLVDGPLRTTLKVVAVGDFNSPPTGPDSGAYGILTSRSNGQMRDAWVVVNPKDPGYTFGQDPDLRNPVSKESIRIDLILVRTAAVKSLEAVRVGTTPPVPGGLWASDHFGVVARLQLP